MLEAGHWQVVGVTGLVVVGCVLLHYEALNALDLVLQRMHVHWRRQRLLLLMLALLALHIAEIWLFATGYWWLAGDGTRGAVIAPGGTVAPGFLDLVYFSAVVYSTLGLGDLVPHGALRFLVGTEAITGFLLVTWSASFTFLEMERWWRRPRRH